jgi:hypothetical protein
MNGGTGTIDAAVSVSASERGILEDAVLPNQLDAGKLWGISSDTTRLSDPPVAILDAATLQTAARLSAPCRPDDAD